MDRPIVDGRWRVHINGEGGMMGSVDMIASEGHERSELWLRAKRVTVVFNDTPMEEGSGVFFLTLLTSSSLCSHSLRHPCDLTHMEEVSGVFFLTLLTSLSLCPHSLRHPCVLTHFVIPVFSHP